MTRLLITGASGFIGQRILRHLSTTDTELHVVARHSKNVGADITWHCADLLKPGSAKQIIEEVRPQKLLHLAWNAIPGRFWTASDNLDWLRSTIELHQSFAEFGGSRAVYAGTCAEYDWTHTYLDESSTPIAPETLYGTAKMSAGKAILAAAKQGGPSVAWARMFFLYGPGEPSGRLVSDVTCSLLKGLPVDCTSGRQERDFMHVDDVARAFMMLLECDYCGVVNVASGTCVPIRRIIEEIGKNTDAAHLIQFGAKAARPDDPPRLAANTSVLNDRLGFRPQFDLQTGILDTVNWWRDHLAKQL